MHQPGASPKLRISIVVAWHVIRSADTVLFARRRGNRSAPLAGRLARFSISAPIPHRIQAQVRQSIANDPAGAARAH